MQEKNPFWSGKKIRPSEFLKKVCAHPPRPRPRGAYRNEKSRRSKQVGGQYKTEPLGWPNGK